MSNQSNVTASQQGGLEVGVEGAPPPRYTHTHTQGSNCRSVCVTLGRFGPLHFLHNLQLQFLINNIRQIVGRIAEHQFVHFANQFLLQFAIKSVDSQRACVCVVINKQSLELYRQRSQFKTLIVLHSHRGIKQKIAVGRCRWADKTQQTLCRYEEVLHELLDQNPNICHLD